MFRDDYLRFFLCSRIASKDEVDVDDARDSNNNIAPEFYVVRGSRTMNKRQSSFRTLYLSYSTILEPHGTHI